MPSSPTTAKPGSPAPVPRRRRLRVRVPAVLVLAALLVPALAGCLRVHASMGLSSNDLVSGRIVAAAVPANSEDPGPQLTVPETLAAKVRVEPYDQDGYKGSEVYFDDLNFGEVEQLGQLSEQAQGLFELTFRRHGDLVVLDGRVDLESLGPEGSDVQLSVAFPAEVSKTNGDVRGDAVVAWHPTPGEVSRIHAEVGYADPNTRSFSGWAGIVGGITLAIAAIVAAVAYLDRNPAAPGAPAGISLRRWWGQVKNGR